MAFTGYLKIEDIKGESKRADHEDEIDCFGVEWQVQQSSSASVGSGRTRSRATIGDFVCHKWMDAASPYLALACMQGKNLAEVVFMARKDSGDAHLDYLQVTMKNCIISGYKMEQTSAEAASDDMVAETVKLSFEHITYKYVVQAEDHSAGDEHEVEYDAVAGK
jgi:type VI secretion system secreted protein Hcp